MTITSISITTSPDTNIRKLFQVFLTSSRESPRLSLLLLPSSLTVNFNWSSTKPYILLANSWAAVITGQATHESAQPELKHASSLPVTPGVFVDDPGGVGWGTASASSK